MAEKSRVARYAGEFLGTFLLVLAIGFNMLSQSWLHAPMGIACALTVLSCSLFSVSGAHLNPAVTLSLFARNRFPFEETMMYILMQNSGGMLGAIVYSTSLSASFDLRPVKGSTWKQTGAIEFVYTFALCLVMISMSTLKRLPGETQFRGLAVGLLMLAPGYAAGHLTKGGGWCNPAVAFAVDVVSRGGKFNWAILYLNCQGAAALAAALAALCIWPSDHDRFHEETPRYSIFSKLLSEVIGTFLVVFTIAMSTVANSEGGPLAVGGLLTSLIFAFYSCSGAHFNPATTIACLVGRCGDFDVCRALLYIQAQLLGACGAMHLMHRVTKDKRFPIWGVDPVGVHTQHGLDDASPAMVLRRALFAEGLFSFLICLVYLRVTRKNSPVPQFFGLAIGMCHAAGAYTVRWVSGGIFNSAVMIGALSTRLSGVVPHDEPPNRLRKVIAAYVAAQIAGAVIAAVVFRILPEGGARKPLLAGDGDDNDEEEEPEEVYDTDSDVFKSAKSSVVASSMKGDDDAAGQPDLAPEAGRK
jgi:aquaporin Z